VTDPIEAYLDELADRLRSLPGSEIRRVLAEAEDHLRTSADSLVAAGATPADADRRAIELFGEPAAVAAAVRSQHPAGLTGIALDAIRKLSIVAVVGLCAIGLSGVLSEGLGAAFGKAFVAGDGPGVTYTAARCADFRAFHPEAATCAQAATAHHFDETVGYREEAGVLGLMGLVALIVLLRLGAVGRWLRTGPLPASTTPLVGTVAFGIAAAALLGLGTMEIVFGITNGTGSLLSDGLVAAAAFALSAWWLAQAVRGDRSTTR
jgi:hypothetical protein